MKSFKVAIGMKIQEGPWGGGNQFGKTLSSYLEKRGCRILYDLSDSDIDIILLTEPRKTLKSSAFNDKDILKYLSFKNSNAIVIHRINECDERKGTKNVNNRLIEANYVADYTIFISSWLRTLFMKCGIENKPNSVILNGADAIIFNREGASIRSEGEKLKLVTHHWGANYLKGFDIYTKLDTLLNDSIYSNKFEFTYIGNKPDNIKFRNTKHISPRHGKNLASELKKNHVYLTASQNEPAGMHHIEGSLCGLPLLYRKSGALPEYCDGFGISFTSENFSEKLHEMTEKYDCIIKKMLQYPYTAERMCKNYYNLFVKLLVQRGEILNNRKWTKKPIWLLKTLLLR